LEFDSWVRFGNLSDAIYFLFCGNSAGGIYGKKAWRQTEQQVNKPISFNLLFMEL